jgi:hypothetical protein
MPPAPKHSRRWFQFGRPQFSLRLVVLVMALFAVLSAWRGALRQRQRTETAVERAQLETELNRLVAWQPRIWEEARRGEPTRVAVAREMDKAIAKIRAKLKEVQ